jgi:RNA polymerase sigma-70 factor (ECF subfamily)
MQGDRDAFGILAERSFGRLVGTAGLILRDADAGDDAVQDALVRAWRDLPGLRDPDRFDAWLFRVLMRSCGDQHRRQRRHRHDQLPAEGRRTASDSSQLVADRDELEMAIGRLSVDHRIVVVLHYYLGLSQPEIAEATGQPVGTVKSRLSRGVVFLRAELAAGSRVSSIGERPA